VCYVNTEFLGCWAGEEGYVAVEYVVVGGGSFFGGVLLLMLMVGVGVGVGVGCCGIGVVIGVVFVGTFFATAKEIHSFGRHLSISCEGFT